MKVLAGWLTLRYENGEAKSPIAKFLSEAELSSISRAETSVLKMETLIFFGADKRSTVNKVFGRLRTEFADHFELKDPDVIALCWIVDFPFYEWDEGAKKSTLATTHLVCRKVALRHSKRHTDEEKLSILADQYDMVMNGYEICSGGVRNHNPEVLYKVFSSLATIKPTSKKNSAPC